MTKKIGIAILVLLIGYVIYAFSSVSKEAEKKICKNVTVEITNGGYNQFIDTLEIKKAICEQKFNPINKTLDELNTFAIENFILEKNHVKKAQVFISNKGDVRIVIEEKKPLLRVIANKGKSYYIDEEGEKLELSNRYVAYVPVATGAITDEFATSVLYPFAKRLRENEFWNAQVEQIIVRPNGDLAFSPKVGNHLVVIGNLDNIDSKLKRLKTFYNEGLNKIGWNKYETIDLRFNEQVVCTPKE